MRKLSLSPVSLLLAFATVTSLVACSSSDDDRSQVVVDVVLGPTVATPAMVRIAATQNSALVRSADFAWTRPSSRTMQFGLFIPAGITGQVLVSAVALDAAGAVIAEGTPMAVALQAGAASAPVTVAIGPQDGPPAGYDGGVPDLGPAVEAGGTPLIDGGTHDARAEVGLDADKRDVTPMGDGAKDALEDAGDVAAPSSDAVDGSQGDGAADDAVGHTPAWEAALNIENDRLDWSYDPVIVVDPVREHVYVAWTDSTTVKVRRWNRSTGVWDDTVVLDTRGDPNGPAIGIDGQGAVMVLWGQNTRSDSSLDGLWVARAADGVAWSLPSRITSGGVFAVKVAVARNGMAHAVFNRQGSGWPLHTAYFDGTAWLENTNPIDPNEYHGDSNCQFALGADGDALLIFSKDWGVAATNLTGHTFSEPAMLNPNYETLSAYDRYIAGNRKGEAMVIWTERSGQTNYVLLGRNYRPGQGWGSVLAPIVTASDIGGIGLTLDEQGTATVFWQQSLNTGGANFMVKSGPSSGPWGDVTILETDNVAGRLGLTTEYAFPSVAIDASGNPLAVWRKDRSTEAAKTYGAYGTALVGGAWLPEVKLGMKTGLDISGLSMAVADSGFGAAAFRYWSSETTTDPDAYSIHVAFFR